MKTMRTKERRAAAIVRNPFVIYPWGFWADSIEHGSESDAAKASFVRSVAGYLHGNRQVAFSSNDFPSGSVNEFFKAIPVFYRRLLSLRNVRTMALGNKFTAKLWALAGAVIVGRVLYHPSFLEWHPLLQASYQDRMIPDHPARKWIMTALYGVSPTYDELETSPECDTCALHNLAALRVVLLSTSAYFSQHKQG